MVTKQLLWFEHVQKMDIKTNSRKPKGKRKRCRPKRSLKKEVDKKNERERYRRQLVEAYDGKEMRNRKKLENSVHHYI